ncbi:MAG: hypothetical protein WDN26_11840 [Chitinophagaceae bacterium]
MKTLISLILLLSAVTAKSQHYYNDIVSNNELINRIKTLVDNKVKSITATGFDPQGAKTADYNEWQEIDADNNMLKVTTRNGQQVTRQFYRFDKQFRVISVIDSSTDIKSLTAYNYENNNLVSIKTTVNDTLQGLSQSEEHQWKYNSSGKPVKMWRIVNNTDSNEYRFTLDEKGNITDEKQYRRNYAIDSILYYYDESNRLTDIVRYDKKARRLLPDFMFEYDDNSRVIQKITTLSAANPNYLIWRYLFNEKGLKTKEALFNKQKEVQGRIEYTFTFSQ